MKTTKITENLYKIEAEENFTLVDKDKKQVYSKVAFAPTEITTFIELPDNVAEELRKSLEDEYNSLQP